MKRFKDFINEAFTVYDGDFKVTEEMVMRGKLIKNKIPYHVTGDFDCSDLGLTTLVGCPKIVGGDFIAKYNLLKDLKGGPEFVHGDNYNVKSNDLTSLEGSPKEVGFLDVHHNDLKNLKGSPRIVHCLNINGNKNLTSLEGLPNKIKSDFWFNDVRLPSLEKFFLYKNKIDFKSDEDYYLHILKYTIKEHPWQEFKDLKTGVNWPKGFFTKELYDSVKGINKFNL